MNRSYILKLGNVSIRCNKYEILISKGQEPDPSYKKCDSSVLEDILINLKHLVTHSRDKVILYFDDENKHVYRDDRFNIIIYRNIIYLTLSSKQSRLDPLYNQVSGVDSLLNHLNDFFARRCLSVK